MQFLVTSFCSLIEHSCDAPFDRKFNVHHCPNLYKSLRVLKAASGLTFVAA
jgi:hypothetical protein